MNNSLLKVNCFEITSCGKYFIVSLSDGFKVFKYETDFSLLLSRRFESTGIGLVSLFQTSSLFVLVGDGNNQKIFPQNKVFLWEDIKLKSISEFELENKIIDTKLTSTGLLILTKSKLHFVKFGSLRSDQLFKVKIQKGMRKRNIIDFVEFSNKTKYLAFPSTKPGSVSIVNVVTNKGICELQYNDDNYQFIKFSHDGTLIGIISGDGSNVRLFGVQSKRKKKQKVNFQEFKNALNNEKIISMAIHKNNKFLATTSNLGYFQIFKILIDPNSASIIPTDKPIEPMIKIKLQISNSICEFKENSEIMIVSNNCTAYLVKFDPKKHYIISVNEYNYLKGTNKLLSQIKDLVLLDDVDENQNQNEIEKNHENKSQNMNEKIENDKQIEKVNDNNNSDGDSDISININNKPDTLNNQIENQNIEKKNNQDDLKSIKIEN
ncbi:autophagy-related 18a [Anaeramoeba flamelloides]|uniref:Autophagy-related 18a n=1 Tax=Anaeramoeba flamelloides TaxID=1746091 RepID=A0ABQ8YXP8_9EUKA|nr:autophagy-related 18a [Anaeramoeba flamelloides]